MKTGRKHQALDARRGNMFWMDPHKLILIEDENHPLYDARVKKPLNMALVAGIKAEGILQPVVVSKDGTVQAGRQRVRAARYINEHLGEGEVKVEVPCVVKSGDDAAHEARMVMENELRENDDALARAQKARRMLDRCGDEARVAVAFGVSKRGLIELLSLLDLAAPVKKAVQSGALSVSAAATLAKLDRAEQVKKLDAVKTAGGKATVRKIKAAVKGNGTVSTAKTAKQIERLHTRVGMLLDALNEEIDAAARNGSPTNGDKVDVAQKYSEHCVLLGWVLGKVDDAHLKSELGYDVTVRTPEEKARVNGEATA